MDEPEEHFYTLGRAAFKANHDKCMFCGRDGSTMTGIEACKSMYFSTKAARDQWIRGWDDAATAYNDV